MKRERIAKLAADAGIMIENYLAWTGKEHTFVGTSIETDLVCLEQFARLVAADALREAAELLKRGEGPAVYLELRRMADEMEKK